MNQSEKLRSSISAALLSTAALEVGAAGLAAVFSAALLDWTGLGAHSTLFAISSLSISVSRPLSANFGEFPILLNALMFFSPITMIYPGISAAGAGALAVMGLWVLPFQRMRIKQQLREKITTLRAQVGPPLLSLFVTDSVR